MNDFYIFINRKKELDFLQQEINKIRTKSKILLISASSGIGKSALVDKAISNIAHSNKYRVSITIGRTEDIEEGFVLKEITKLIHKNSTNSQTYPNLNTFLEVDSFYKNVANGLIKVILDYLKIKEFGDGFSERRNKSKENVKEWLGEDKELLTLSLDYISFIAQHNKIFIAIDNFQSIDYTSLMFLRNFLNVSQNVYIVGECTINTTTNNNKVYELISLFEYENIEVGHLKLEKLDKKELLDAIQNEKEVILGIVEASYDNSDGNLHKFQLLRSYTYSQKYDIKFSNYNTITKQLINNLDDTSFAIIISIFVHKEEVSMKLFNLYMQLSTLFDFNTEPLLNNKIQDLVELGLIKITNEKLLINHDSVSLYLKDDIKAKRIQIIAIRNWIRLYENFKNNCIGHYIDYLDSLLWQVYFIIKIESLENLPSILEKIYNLISVSPTFNILVQLEKIALACEMFEPEEKNIDIFRWLIVMYYRWGYSDKVVELVTPNFYVDDTILLCYVAALSTISHKDAFYMIDSIDSNIIGSATKLGLILVTIRTLRSNDDFENCKKLWYEHYKKETFKNTSFEAGFFKYCTLAEHDNYDFRINCSMKALKLFNSINDRFGQISTCIALSRDFAYVGNFVESRRYLELAEQLANKTIYPRYSLYNNRAMLDIITNNITPITKDALINGLKICSNIGDRLILYSNILVIAIIENDTAYYGHNIYKKLLNKILQEFNPKDTIIHLCLYNCYRYALLIDDKDTEEKLWKYLNELELRQDIDLWNYLIFNQGENPYPMVVKKEYYPCFMLGWNLDYYTALSNFQSII